MLPYRRYRYRVQARIFSLESSTIEKDQRGNVRPVSMQTTASSTGITYAVRKNETTTPTTVVEATPSAANKEGDERISFPESQFYARTSNTPVVVKRQNDVIHQKEIVDSRKQAPTESLFYIPIYPSVSLMMSLSTSASFAPKSAIIKFNDSQSFRTSSSHGDFQVYHRRYFTPLARSFKQVALNH